MRSTSDRLEEEWRLLRCCDCDPDHVDVGEEPEYPEPYVPTFIAGWKAINGSWSDDEVVWRVRFELHPED